MSQIACFFGTKSAPPNKPSLFEVDHCRHFPLAPDEVFAVTKSPVHADHNDESKKLHMVDTKEQALLNIDDTAIDSNIDDNVQEDEEVTTGQTAHIDDPVRIYLMQMGEMPLLSRDEEVKAAQRIEKARRTYRYGMLATDFVLAGAVKLLKDVRDGRLRLDRTIEVSVTNLSKKKRIVQLLSPNLETLHHLLEKNQEDFQIVVSKRQPDADRHDAWQRIIRRRTKAIRLIEEFGLRTNRLRPILEKVRQISLRMDELKTELDEIAVCPETKGRTAEMREELEYLMRISLDTPATLRRRINKTAEAQEEYEAARRYLSAGKFAFGCLDRQTFIATVD